MNLDHALPLVSAIQPGHGPQPVPVQISCGNINISGKDNVVIQISSANGVQIYFIPPEMANNVAKNLIDAAKSALAVKDGKLPSIPASIIGGDAVMTIGRKS